MRMRGLLAALAAFALLTTTSVGAHDEGDIVITGVWARPTVGAEMSGMATGGHGGMSETPMPGQSDAMATPEGEQGGHMMGGTTPSAAYMEIENRGGHPVALVAAASPVAMSVEIHETTIANDVARMAQVEGGLEIAPGDSVSLRPGSFHIMIMGLVQDLAPGDAIALDLTFEMRETDAEPMTITVAAVITDLPPMDMGLTLTESLLFADDGDMIPAALIDVALPVGLLAYARLENRTDADAPFASALFMDDPAPLYVLVDGELFEIDEYDVGVGETVEIVVALGDVVMDEITSGALPFTLVMSDETTLALAAAMPGAGTHMHE